MFVGKAGTCQVLHSRVGSWSYPQTLDKVVEACQEQLLQKFVGYICKKCYNIGPMPLSLVRNEIDKSTKTSSINCDDDNHFFLLKDLKLICQIEVVPINYFF
jgi:hypothetical protein